MIFSRRQLLDLAAGAATLPVVSRTACAEAYPTRPVRVVVPYAPAGVADITARLMGQWLSERLGQTFVIENLPGAGTNIGTEAVIRSAPDGYTFLLVSPANAINATLYEKLNLNFIRDITPVGSIGRGPNVMVVNSSTPVKTVPEFIAYTKANPGKINMASAGNGSSQHLSGELFKMMAGVDMVHVPYRGGGPAITDLLGGQVQVYFASTASSVEFIRAGKLRALAVTTATRSEALPDTPTMSEFISGYEASAFYGFGTTNKTATAIVEKVSMEIMAGLADNKLKAQLADLGIVPLSMPTSEFRRLIAEETEKWSKVIRFAGLKPE